MERIAVILSDPRARLMAGLALAGSIVLALHGLPALVLTTLLGKLAYSTSDGAARFLLGYVFACALAVGLLGRQAVARPRVERGVMGLGATSLLLGHGLGLALSVNYFAQHGLDWTAHVHHWKDGANSYTALLHSHLGKPAIAVLLGSAPGAEAGQSAPYDMGAPFASAVGWAHLALLALAVTFVLATAAGVFGAGLLSRRHPQAPWLVMAWVWASAAALKAMLDGGLLSERVPMSISLLAMLLAAPATADLPRLMRRWGAGLLLGAAGVEVLLHGLDVGAQGLPGIGGTLFTLTLYGWMLCAHQPHPRWADAVAAAFVALSLAVDAAYNLLPLMQPLPVGTWAYIVDAAGRDVRREPAPAGATAWQVYRRWGNDARKPCTVLLVRPGRRQQLPAAQRLAVFDLMPLDIGTSGGTLQAGGDISLNWLPGRSQRHDQHRNSGPTLTLALGGAADSGLPAVLPPDGTDVLDRNNYWVYLHAASMRLRQSGLTEFLLVPVRQVRHN